MNLEKKSAISGKNFNAHDLSFIFFFSCLETKFAKYSDSCLMKHLRFLVRHSRFPSFMLPLCVLHFRTLGRFCRKSALGTSGILAAFALSHRTKDKKNYLSDRKRDLLFRFRAFLTDYVGMIFHVAAFLIFHRFLYKNH